VKHSNHMVVQTVVLHHTSCAGAGRSGFLLH